MDQVLEKNAMSTPRLVLRPFRESDAARIAELMNNWNVVRMLAMPPFPYALSDAERYVTNTLGRTEDGKAFDWAITEADIFIGGIGYGRRDGGGSLIGYWLGEPYWGRGFMSEAVGAVLRQYFATQTAAEIQSGVFIGNTASLRIQEKLGFEVVGESDRYCVPRACKVGHLDTRLTRKRFEELAA